FLARQRCIALCVALEELAVRPLDHEIMQPVDIARFEGANDVWVLHALSEVRFANEACYGSSILSQLVAEDLERDRAVVGVRGAVHHGRAPLPDEICDRISGKRLTDEIIARPAANLTRAGSHGKRPPRPL